MNYINLLFSSIISSFFAILSVSNLSHEKLNFKIILRFTLIIFPLLIIVCSFFDGITRLTLNIIIIVISLYFSLFSKDITKSVYYALIYELLVFIVEIVLSLIFVSILRLDLNSYQSFSFSLLIFSICNSLIIYLISRISMVSNITINFNKIITKNNSDWVYIIIMVILMIFLLTFNKNNLIFDIRFYINVGMVIFVIVSLIYVIQNKFQKEKFEDKYNQMIEYVSKYEKIINEQGKKNHEYNNQLMVLSGYVNNPKKLKEYLKLIIEDQKGNQNYTIKQLGYFPDGGIKGLIYDKLSVMEENNIKPFLYINQDIKDIFEKQFDIRTYSDITKLLGVFLDNAIDASKKAVLKEIEIEMKLDGNYLIISIGNTYDKTINLDKIGKKGFSTKGLGHGFGLSIVKDISKNNSKIETFSEVTEDMYRQIIMIDLK